MDRLDAMRVFVRVVERGSFSAVARELGIGQPAISKQIAALEDHLGAQLVQRTSRSLSITEAGTNFYDVAVRLVGELDAAIATVRRGEAAPAGLVRVTVAPVFGRLYIVPKLEELFARYPKISVELLVSHRPANLIADGIDVAIRNGELSDSSLIARPIGETPMLTVGSAAYLDRKGEPATPKDLVRHECIVFVTRGAPRAWHYQKNGKAFLYDANGSFRSNDAEQIRAAVLGNVGLAQAPGWIFARELANGTVRAILRDYESRPLPITAVRPGGRKLASKVRVFLDFLSESFAKEPMLGTSMKRRFD